MCKSQWEKDLDHEWRSGLAVGSLITALILLFIVYILAETGVIK